MENVNKCYIWYVILLWGKFVGLNIVLLFSILLLFSTNSFETYLATNIYFLPFQPKYLFLIYQLFYAFTT